MPTLQNTLHMRKAVIFADWTDKPSPLGGHTAAPLAVAGNNCNGERTWMQIVCCI